MITRTMEAATETVTWIDGESNLTIAEVLAVARGKRRVALGDNARERMTHSRTLLDAKLSRGESIYGVTTGFGGNSHHQIAMPDVRHLQSNLLRFLKAGTGSPLTAEIVRAAMLLRVNALSHGWSAPRVAVVEQLIACLNADITPLVPEFGSVGASGDLIPSAYIANCLCGAGAVIFQGAVMPSAEALAACGIPALELEAKEGLALCNGTTTMTALAVFALHEFETSLTHSIGAIALAVEAMGSSTDYYNARIQEAKGHPGQIEVARILRQMLEGSQLSVPVAHLREQAAVSHIAPDLAQAPYSLRCVPQGLGAMWEALADARVLIDREINSVNDNPLIDPVTGEVLYTGNFYGGHIARVMDCLKIDISTLANWLHSIVAMLMDSRFSKGLPNSLSPRVGLHQGLKGLQLSHTSLVTFLRQQSAPSSVHTLPTEQFNQDVVSLGTNAALTTLRMANALRDVVGMTLLTAAQAVDMRGAADLMGEGTTKLYHALRQIVAVVDEDRPLDEDISNLANALSHSTLPIGWRC